MPQPKDGKELPVQLSGVCAQNSAMMSLMRPFFVSAQDSGHLLMGPNFSELPAALAKRQQKTSWSVFSVFEEERLATQCLAMPPLRLLELYSGHVLGTDTASPSSAKHHRDHWTIN